MRSRRSRSAQARTASSLPRAGLARRRTDRLRLAELSELRDRAQKLGAEPKTTRSATARLDALLEAVTPRTKLVVCHPNNPTGTMNTRGAGGRLLRTSSGSRPHRARPGLLRVRGRPGLCGRRRGVPQDRRRVVVLRTFSKIFGLAGLRVGYGVAPAAVVTAIAKVRRAFDITLPRRSRRWRAWPRPAPPPSSSAAAASMPRVAPRSSRRFASTASTPPGPPSRTSSSRRSARTRGRSSSSCFRRASSSGRP